MWHAAGKYMKSQKEINLGKDLEMRDRKDTYRNFLLFCVSGDVVQLPMGSTGQPYSLLQNALLDVHQPDVTCRVLHEEVFHAPQEYVH